MALLRPGLLIALILSLLPPCLAVQSSAPEAIFTISVAAPIAAKDVQVRYFFTGEFGGRGSSVADTIEGNRVVIKAGAEGKSAKTFKLIAYAPGCQFVTISVDDLSSSGRQGDFQCQRISKIQLRGRTDVSRFEQKELQLEVFYGCDWAMHFFGIADGAISPLSLGKASVAADGSFTVDLPDFSADPLWSSLSNDATLMFSLAEAGSGKRLATLQPSDLSSGSSLKVAPSYPEIEFTIRSN